MNEIELLPDGEAIGNGVTGKIVSAAADPRHHGILNVKINIAGALDFDEERVSDLLGGVVWMEAGEESDPPKKMFRRSRGKYNIRPSRKGRTRSVPELKRNPRTAHAIVEAIRKLGTVRSLEAGKLPISKTALAPDKRAKLLLRGLENARADLKRAGGAYTMSDVQSLLGNISRQAISKRVRDHSLISIKGEKGTTVFPTLQFTRDGQPIAGIKEVIEALPSDNGWAVLNFLINRHNDLEDNSPIELLRDGKLSLVVSAAKRMGVQGG